MSGGRLGRIAAAAMLLAAAAPAAGYKEVPPPARVVLPKALSPADSLAAIAVPDDLVVELVAAEPTVLDPIDLAWDAAGRLWVVEMADYPQGMDGKGKPGGRIRVLESTRGDGVYDKATLFADGLRTPTSVRPWGRGVLTVAVPDLVLLEETDGDGRADRREVLFTGLAEGNEQHLANGLQWGLDGWLYLANGNSGGKIASARGGPVLDVGQRDFRVSIATGAVEVLAGRSQTGLNRDDWGNWFGGNNSNPIWHYALEDRYLRRNPHFVPPAATVPVSAVPGAARVFPRSETLARFNDPHGFNHFTSACGTMIYRDDALGAGYAGNVFVCEPVHNLVHREVLRPAGATFRSERAASEREAEFMASKDPWSRFVAVRAGPDGALYVADMYRLVVEHPKWIPDAWQKELGNVRAGDDKGRIYRVRKKGAPLRPVPRLDRADAATLVAALASPSGTVRDLAQQELVQRGAAAGDGANAALAAMVRTAASAPARAQALWTLQLRGALTAELVRERCDDPHPGVRRQAVRLSEPWLAQGHEALGAAVVRAAEDPDAGVRQQAAYALGEMKPEAGAATGAALARLLRSDEDKFVRAAAMSSALPQASAVSASVRAGARADDPVVLELATATANAQALAGILVELGTQARAEGAERLRQFRTLGQLLDFLQRGGKSLAQLPASPELKTEAALTAADGVLAAARTAATDAQAPAPERVAAVALLGRGRSKQGGFGVAGGPSRAADAGGGASGGRGQCGAAESADGAGKIVGGLGRAWTEGAGGGAGCAADAGGVGAGAARLAGKGPDPAGADRCDAPGGVDAARERKIGRARDGTVVGRSGCGPSKGGGALHRGPRHAARRGEQGCRGVCGGVRGLSSLRSDERRSDRAGSGDGERPERAISADAHPRSEPRGGGSIPALHGDAERRAHRGGDAGG